MGNASVDWLRGVVADKTHPPFYLWLGPHAPHLPSTPAPWCKCSSSLCVFFRLKEAAAQMPTTRSA